MKIKQLFIVCLFLTFTLQAQEKTVRLKVVSYNLRFGELASLEEIAAFINSEQPDMVALQEVDVKTYRDRTPHQHGKDFITELGYLTGMLTAYAKTIPYASGYYGIGVLSKYPMSETKKILLPMPEGAKEQRALLKTNLELPDGRMVTFVSTHLDYPSSVVRQVQVDALTSALKDNPYPIIVAGDFNAHPDSPEIRKGMAQWKEAGSPDFTVPADAPRAKIDYIFCYPENVWTTLSASTPKVTLSDHLPVTAELQLTFP